MKAGIVGLPNVGKSTLFNCLSNAKAQSANFPFCTIEPNIGVVNVPDPRINKLEELVKPERVQMATVDIVDIAGLVKGASKGEGLGNQFLGNIRECNAIIHVLRCFDNDNIVFQFKNKTYTYNRNDCKKIFTNVMITKFTFYNKKIRCAKNDYFDDNTGQLKDKLNKEFFPNAIITKIWD